MTQSTALDIMKMGRNVFITGPAGSGKTFVVNRYISYLKEHGVSVGVTASTGIAATHMGGITIHAWSGIGVRDYIGPHDLEEISARASVRDKVKDAKVLIIDEISMLHHFRLDLVDRVLKHIRSSSEPFGGVQVILCGDFFQLPPVSRAGEQEALFAFHSEAWKQGRFTICYLDENHRQKDDPLVNVLNELRAGIVSPQSRQSLNDRMVVQDKAAPVSAEEPTRLYTHNADVDAINEREFDRLDGHEAVYEMSSVGRKALVDTLKKSCLAPEKLRLKKGARVMCVKNNFEQGYVNGTLGIVVSCGWGIDPVIHTASTPDYPQGRKVTIELSDWTIEEDGRVLAKITQYPLRLAWAITVHKSQGMSLDKVEIDLSRTFEPGMGYVALSRARSLAGLLVLGIHDRAFDVDQEVLEHDGHLRDLSARAESVVEHTDRTEIDAAQATFLARVAPMHSATKRKTRGTKVRVSTYESTALLVKECKSLKEIAQERGLTVETIISHIEELIGLGPDHGGLVLEDISYLKKSIEPRIFTKIGSVLGEVSARQNDGRPPLLSPVKSRVRGATFLDIRLVRVLLGYVKVGDKKKPPAGAGGV